MSNTYHSLSALLLALGVADMPGHIKFAIQPLTTDDPQAFVFMQSTAATLDTVTGIMYEFTPFLLQRFIG